MSGVKSVVFIGAGFVVCLGVPNWNVLMWSPTDKHLRVHLVEQYSR